MGKQAAGALAQLERKGIISRGNGAAVLVRWRPCSEIANETDEIWGEIRHFY